MSWEYLKNERFNERYRIVAEQLGDLSDKVILDLNCGEAGFRNFIKCKKYIANDINFPDDKKNGTFWEFLNIPDDEVDVESDVIVIFGYGGGEFTGEPLESKTAGETVIRLAEKYRPKFIAIEMAQKWEDDFEAMSWIRKSLSDYICVFNRIIDIEPVKHYHDKRLICIFKLCGHFKEN